MMEQLVTDAFQAAARQIDDALSKGSTQVAKRRIKMLMNKLLENPSEGTIGYSQRCGNDGAITLMSMPILRPVGMNG